MLLDELESQSIYILREAFNKFESLAMLWSIGKDSTVLLWLARKAFFGHVPFPLVHVDTTYKIPSMIEYRDRLVREWKLELIVGQNEEVLRQRPHVSQRQGHARRMLRHAEKRRAAGRSWTSTTSPASSSACGATKSPPAPRNATSARATRTWNGTSTDQPPEFWDQFKTDFETGTHVRIHPLLHWTELNVWEYIEREKVPVIPALFRQQPGRALTAASAAPPAPSRSNPTRARSARSSRSCAHTKTPERAGRAQDKESEDAFEKLRRDGYM